MISILKLCLAFLFHPSPLLHPLGPLMSFLARSSCPVRCQPRLQPNAHDVQPDGWSDALLRGTAVHGPAGHGHGTGASFTNVYVSWGGLVVVG